MAAKLMDLVESGLGAEDIMKEFKKEHEDEQAAEHEEAENFAEEIQMISRPFAYRAGTLDDIDALYRLFNEAYKPDIEGSESFRVGPAIEKESLVSLFEDTSYQWIVMETIDENSVILGACCFSTDGISRCNGKVEGTLGSIRLFGVLPRYHGFCIGARLLQKIEDIVFKSGCVRIMSCIPSTRKLMQKWVERRNYVRVGSTLYPAAGVGHVLKTVSDNSPSKVELVRFMKTKPSTSVADTKNAKIYTLNQTSETSTAGASSSANEHAPMTSTQGSVPVSALKRGGGGLVVSDEQFADHGCDYDVDSTSGGKEPATKVVAGGGSDRHHLPPAWRATQPIPEAYDEDMADN